MASALIESLDLHNFVDRIVAAVSSNEGGFTSINANDAGYGISIGIRQWNQKAGELPTLLRAWHDSNPHKFEITFGQHAQKLLNEGWVRTTDFWSQSELMINMNEALADREFQSVQVRLAREFVAQALKLGIKYGFKTELGLAEVVDITNQKGFGGAESALSAVGGAGADEVAAVQRLEQSTNRPGGQRRLTALMRQFSGDRTAVLDD